MNQFASPPRWPFLLVALLLAPPLTAEEPGSAITAGEYGSLNFPTVTMGGTQFWSDELVFHRWRIQCNVYTGHYRLLDAEDYRRAWGTLEQCRAKLDAIRRDENLPPMKGRAVITLHGLFRSRDVMQELGSYLEEEHDYTWLNVSYASTRRSIDDHAASLARVIANLDGITEIDFVCHSLGNLVVRRYLGEASLPSPRWKTDARIKRMVMIAPPNNGAHLAEIFKKNKLYGLLMGPSGKEIATDFRVVEKRLAIPKFEFGIIAGSNSGSLLDNPLISGADDLVVSVEETRLAGATDFITFPLQHGQMLHDTEVHKRVASFLTRGFFVSEEEKHPVLAGAAGGDGK